MHVMTEASRRSEASGVAPTATICTAPGAGITSAASLASCTASSRVGATTSTLPAASSGPSIGKTSAPARPRRESAGNKKASDFPDPVSACSTRLSPLCARGSAAVWIGVGPATPRAARASTTAAGNDGIKDVNADDAEAGVHSAAA